MPREAALRTLRTVVAERPRFAHLVIPDLTAANDWEAVPAIEELVSHHGEKFWLRQPILDYLNACPLPDARRILRRMQSPTALRAQ